jgi:hypothetical protein
MIGSLYLLSDSLRATSGYLRARRGLGNRPQQANFVKQAREYGTSNHLAGETVFSRTGHQSNKVTECCCCPWVFRGDTDNGVGMTTWAIVLTVLPVSTWGKD